MNSRSLKSPPAHEHAVRSPAAVLVCGLVAVVAAAVAPAGLGTGTVPTVSWAIWALVLALALAAFRASGVTLVASLRRLAWLLPLVAMLAVPAGALALPGRRLTTTAALAARALASTSAAAALATLLGPVGVIAGLRALPLPARIVDVFASAVTGLTVVIRQAAAMLRAREARRPGPGAWSRIVVAPRRTARGFGRLVAALLLRSLERGEALERARRARGIGDR